MKILILEDDLTHAELLADELKELGQHDTATTCDPREARSLLAGDEYDLLVTDWQMGGGDTVQATLEAVRTDHPEVAVLTISAWPIPTDACVDATLSKPFGLAQLGIAVGRAAKMRSLRRKHEQKEN